ncbi:MAG: hypothetical protein AB7R69_00310 [Candidatus Babeliales bacterium]
MKKLLIFIVLFTCQTLWCQEIQISDLIEMVKNGKENKFLENTLEAVYTNLSSTNNANFSTLINAKNIFAYYTMGKKIYDNTKSEKISIIKNQDSVLEEYFSWIETQNQMSVQKLEKFIQEH